uniref:acid phosphatase n=1 Tax=Strigamia maritima TaxID=126957 RepID=T1IIN8_STRMM
MLLSSFGFSKSILWTFLIILNSLLIADAGNSQLKMVQLLFRHGDRTPTKTFPKDQWKDAWPDGLGQLTTLGMQQQFRTGEYLRKRYSHLINDTYNHRTVHVQSTDVDRTLMSAYANLAGFMPPTGRHVWNTNLTWQPIPVHTLPQKEDYLLSLNSDCPQYKKLFAEQMTSPEAEKVNSQSKDFFKFLEKHTGLSINNFNQASSIFDILLIQQIHNLTQPAWVSDDLMERLGLIHLLNVCLRVKTQEQRRLRGGPLIGEMIKNMENKINNRHEKHKIYMYSAHDATVVSVLAALDVFEPHAPPYCSMIMVELLTENGTNFVKILYRNDTSREPYELALKGCSSPCPFNEFVKITEAVIPEDIQEECVSYEDTSVALVGVIAASVISCAVLIAAVAGYAYFKRKRATYKKSLA